jgi:hypothetical protein
VVSRVFRSGLLAEMPDVQLQGMLPVAALRAMHARYNARTHALSAGKLVLQPGSVLRVRLARLDFDQRRIDLALA